MSQVDEYEAHYEELLKQVLKEIPKKKLMDPNVWNDRENFKRILSDEKYRKIIKENFISTRNDDYTISESVIRRCKDPYKMIIFVNRLLGIDGIDLNFQNPSHQKKSILHHIVERGNINNILSLLIRNSNALDLNVQDEFGNTPLHLAVENNDIETLIKLLFQEAIDVNKKNKENKTALHVALANESKCCIWILINHAHYNIDKRAENMLKQPSLASIKAIIQGFELLFRNEVHKFKELIDSSNIIKVNVDDDNGRCTFLQYASMIGFHKGVELLVSRGADLNLICPGKNVIDYPPFMLAGSGGFYKVMEIFMNRDKELVKRLTKDKEENRLKYEFTGNYHRTVLQIVVTAFKRGFNDSSFVQEAEKASTKCNPEDINIEKCIKLLLTNNNNGDDGSKPKFDINNVNSIGETALSLAIKSECDERIIHLLLKNGAYVGQRDVLDFIDPKVLEEFLDDSVQEINDLSREELSKIRTRENAASNNTPNKNTNTSKNISICYDFLFLRPPETSEGDPMELETYSLLQMRNIQEVRHLLKHPVISSFLTLKWNLIRMYFWINMIFYTMFCLSFSLDILQTLNRSSSDNNESTTLIDVVGKLTYVFLFLLCLREMFQYAFNWKFYLRNPENYLDVTVIITGLAYKYEFLNHNTSSAAIVVLFCWAEMILLASKHPYFATELEMVKVVAKNSLNFLMWFLILICAFGLIFHILFQTTTTNNSDNVPVENFTQSCRINDSIIQVIRNESSKPKVHFQLWSNSILKTFVMSLGEFTVDDLNFDANPGISHAIFLSFLFLVAILSFNLFTGIAVNDIDKIKEDARVLEVISRAKNINFLENMAVKNNFFWNVIQCVNTRPLNLFYNDVNLFPKIMKNNRIVVYYENNYRNKVRFSNMSLNLEKFNNEITNWTMEKSIVRDSLAVIRKRKLRLSEVTPDKIAELKKSLVTNLYSEMKQMKESNDRLHNENAQIKESNEHLHGEIKPFKECNDRLHSEIKQIKESNEHLHGEIAQIKQSNDESWEIMKNELKLIRESMIHFPQRTN